MAQARNAYFLIFDEVEVLDFSGAFDVFSMSNFAAGERIFDLHTVSETGGLVTALHGLKIQPDYSFATCPTTDIDILIVPGFPPQKADEFIARHPRVVSWIADRGESVEVLASVCVGALLVGKAGLFARLRATTHHSALGKLREYAPDAKIIPGARYVDNGRIMASAGVSAGLDLSFHILHKLCGAEIALRTANVMEYNWTVNWEVPA